MNESIRIKITNYDYMGKVFLSVISIWFVISTVTFRVKYSVLEKKEKRKKTACCLSFSLIASNIKHLEAITCHAAKEAKYL